METSGRKKGFKCIL